MPCYLLSFPSLKVVYLSRLDPSWLLPLRTTSKVTEGRGFVSGLFRALAFYYKDSCRGNVKNLVDRELIRSQQPAIKFRPCIDRRAY